MIKKEKSISIRPVHLLKYISWYTVFSMIITSGLISIGQVKINQDESIIMYMLLNDALRPLILFIALVASGYIINYATSENINHKSVVNKDLFRFKYKFQLWIIDFLILLFLSCYIVIDRVLNIEILLSKDKLQLIAMLMLSAYFIKFIAWFMYKGLKDQLIELMGVILFAIKSPGYIYQGMRKDINSSPMPEKYKHIFIKLTKTLCIIAVIIIAFMIVGIFFDTIKQYF